MLKAEVAHSLLSLYPNDNIQKKKRDVTSMSSVRHIAICLNIVWWKFRRQTCGKEADNFWFNNSFSAIVSKGEWQFLLPPRQRLCYLTVECLSSVLSRQLYGDLIKEKAIFPNQQNCFKKLSELLLRLFDSEEFKDLG